jgi:hypothetical protein
MPFLSGSTTHCWDGSIVQRAINHATTESPWQLSIADTRFLVDSEFLELGVRLSSRPKRSTQTDRNQLAPNWRDSSCDNCLEPTPFEPFGTVTMPDDLRMQSGSSGSAPLDMERSDQE